MKAISIVGVLVSILIGIVVFTARDYDTGWRELMPPKAKNEFSKKQAEMMQLTGAYRILSLKENEKITIKIQSETEHNNSEKTIFGRDSSEVSIYVYNYPGMYRQGRNEYVTEIKIADENTVITSLLDRPIHYTKGSLLNHGRGDYKEELLNEGKTIYLLQISLEKEQAEPVGGIND